MSQFTQDIEKFNGIYKLPVNKVPTLDYLGQGLDAKEAAALRLTEFKDILLEEVDEVNLIIEKLRQGSDTLEALVDMADWLGDIQVYCASEMAKFGLPIDAVQDIIMSSNFSKLDADGNPIYDARGKVLKGPNYFKPEPAIKELLNGLMTKEAHE
jgi:predicted HAD superfamily Cof-like phosphohydrolase